MAYYGWSHRKIRAQLTPLVAAGGVTCARCGNPIHPYQSWDLGHHDDGVRYQGPEHTTCNRAAGGWKRWHPNWVPPAEKWVL